MAKTRLISKHLILLTSLKKGAGERNVAYLNEFLTLGLIGLLAMISPGPDFVIVTQNSLRYGRKAGLLTSLGIALGCIVHITYCVVGIAVVVAQSIVMFNIIKYLGAAYLIYAGWKGLTARAATNSQSHITTPLETFSALALVRQGFLINVLNPKATLFFLSVFTQVIDPQTPRLIQIGYGIELMLLAFTWFSILSCILANPLLKRKLLTVQHKVEKVLGGFLILFGIKVATLSQ